MNFTKSLQVQAYEYIKNMVLEGQMDFNTIYSETKIAKEMGISRTPVRDAIQYLSQERYIDIIPNKGFCLHKMQMQDFIDTNQIRTAIEGYCARQIAIEYQTEKAHRTFELLENILKKQKEMTSVSLDDFFEADMLFHVAIVGHINNKELTNLFDSYMYRMRNLAIHSLSHEGRIESAYQEHIEIFESMKRGDTIKAYESIVFHMESPRNISVDDVY